MKHRVAPQSMSAFIGMLLSKMYQVKWYSTVEESSDTIERSRGTEEV